MTPSNSQNILVIGGSGFIGTQLVRRLLAAGHAVTIFDIASSKSFPGLHREGDVRDVDALVAACQGVSIVYNLAAAHRDDVRPLSLYEEVNVTGAKNVVAAAGANDVRKIVFTSTVAVYPMGDHSLDETAEPAPFNEYGRTKLAAEQVYQGWQEEGDDRSLIILRPTAVFGTGNRGNVYNLARQIAKRRFVFVGDGQNRKSLAYVENVVEALAFILRLGPGCHLFNYTDLPDYSVESLVRDIRLALGHSPDGGFRIPKPLGFLLGYIADLISFVSARRLPVSSVRVRKFCSNSQFSSERIRQLGFSPPVEFREGLKLTVRSEFCGAPSSSE